MFIATPVKVLRQPLESAGNASTTRRWPSCASPPSALCCENYAIPDDVLGQTLRVEGFYVYRTDLGEEGVDLGKIYDYDIILLDLNLPDISGYEVLRSLRSAKVVTPILILSGLASIEDKIRGLGLGADDYLSKPFHKDELVARIHALVRRSKGHAESRCV